MTSDVLSFDSFPLWQGVAKNYGDFVTKPFMLTVDDQGIISQPYWNPHYFDNPVYKQTQYNHITTLPGASSISKKRNLAYVNFIANAIQQHIPKQSIQVLEIGGGNLFTAEQLMLATHIEHYTIVDPAIQCDSNERISIIPDYYSSKTTTQLYDVIISINCFEHVLYPVEFLENIKKNLSTNGIAILFFPDCERQLKVGDMNMLVHEHLSYFTADSFKKIIHQTGLRALFLHTKNDLLQIVLSKDPAVITNPALEMSTTHSLASFKKQCDKNISFLSQLIQNLSKNDYLLFHGATNGLNSIFFILKNYLNVIPWEKIIIVDNDETKTDLFLPCANAPIQKPSATLYENAKHIIVSAPTFYEEIKKDILSRISIHRNILNILNT
jgi:2-polyprenyl-3-methyl-5-hydroxy-6-metoxy-1,4-benzoquinol methylase